MIIYKAVNKINGMIYIGQTIKSLKQRKAQHEELALKGKGSRFQKALLQYGLDVFEWSIIDTANSIEELDKKEAYWIEFYKSYENGYNSTLGNSNPMNFGPSKEYHDSIMRTPEVRQKISNSMKKLIAEGNYFTLEHRDKISKKLQGNTHFKGHKRDPKSIELTAKGTRKKVSCYDRNNNLVKSFESVKAAALWLYNTKCSYIKNPKDLCNRIKQSYVKNRFYKDLKWKYD